MTTVNNESSQTRYLMNMSAYKRLVTNKWRLVDVKWSNDREEEPDLSPTRHFSEYRLYLESKSLFSKLTARITIWPGKLIIQCALSRHTVFQYTAERDNSSLMGGGRYLCSGWQGTARCTDVLLENGDNVDFDFCFLITDELDDYFHCACNFFDTLNYPVHTR